MQTGLNLRFSKPNINVISSVPQEEDGNGEVCIANISPKERRKRLRLGIIQFVISLVILAVLLITGVDKIWRLVLILPFGAAASGYFQWRDKT